MAQSSNQAFYIEALKAIKQAGEQSPLGSDMRKIYQTKANSLRDTLKKLGYANVDADYGAGVSLANTPGGGKIDWNILANAADILGTSQAGSTRSAFDRALGEYLTRNLPVWQKQNTTTPSSAVTSTTTPVMGGGSAASAIASGQPIRGGVTGGPTAVGRSSVAGTPTPLGTASGNATQVPAGATTAIGGAPGSGGPSAVTAIGGAPGSGGPSPITMADATGTGAGMGSGAGVYGDFIKSEYFKNNDYEGYFISKTPNLPTIKDPATGKVTIDWANPSMPANMYTLYGQGVGFWNTAQGLSKEQLTFDPAAIEKNPAFIEQGKVFTAEMELLLKQNNLNVDAQLAGLKGSIGANEAALKYELNTIKREIGASNWRSRQSLAASGMAFSGMLGYLYGQNEAKGMDATIRATAISAAEIKAIGEQMAILDGSKLAYKSDLEGLYGAKRAAYRASLIDPQNARYKEVEGLLNDAIAGMEGVTAMTAPSLAMGQRADVAAAAQANYETAVELAKLGKQGIWVTPSADGKSYTWKTGLTDAEQTARDSALFDQWYKTEGLNLDWANLDLNKDKLVLDKAKQAFSEWATTQGLNLDAAKLDLEWAKLVETVRSNKAGETGGAEGGAYDPKGDLSILASSGADATTRGMASTRLMAGSGAVSTETMGSFLNGSTYYWNGADNKIYFSLPLDAKNNPLPNVMEVNNPGLLKMSDVEAEQTIDLIEDPIIGMAAWVLWKFPAGTANRDALVNAAIDQIVKNNGLTKEQGGEIFSIYKSNRG